MLELQIDGLVVSYFTAYIQNVPVAEFSDAAMRAAQQILIQVEYRNLENIIQLLLQTTRISRDPAQIVVTRNQGEPFASATDVTKGRGRDRRRRQQSREGSISSVAMMSFFRQLPFDAKPVSVPSTGALAPSGQ
jgi:hypothetical protein